MKLQAWPYCGANLFFEFSSFALLRYKRTFKISELGLIAVQNDFQIFELGLIAAQIGLALLPYTSVLINSVTQYKRDLRIPSDSVELNTEFKNFFKSSFSSRS